MIGGGARGFLSTDMARKDWDGARALGLPITLHTSGPSPIKALEDAGLLGPDVQLVHPLLIPVWFITPDFGPTLPPA